MTQIDLTKPYHVLARIASIHVESEARLHKISVLTDQQDQADAERAELARVARLYLADDETAIRVTVQSIDDYCSSGDYIVSRCGEQIEVCRLAYVHDIPDLTAGEIAEALMGDDPEPPALDESDAFMMAAAEAFELHEDAVDAVAAVLTDGRKFHLPGGVPRYLSGNGEVDRG